MRAKALIFVAIILIGGGAFSLYYGYENANPTFAAIGWAAIIGGALTLLGGLAMRARKFLHTRPYDDANYGTAEITTLIQSMGQIAVADGKVHPKEVETITKIHNQMIGTVIRTSDVKIILRDFHENDDVRHAFERERKLVSPPMKRMIIQSCYIVMMADGNEDNRELKRIYDIAEALSVPQKEVDQLIAIAKL